MRLKIMITIFDLAFWVFEALPLPSTNRNTHEFVFYFPQIKGRIFCPYLMGVWGPSSSLLPIIIPFSLFLISLWTLKEVSVLVFRVWSLSPSSLRKVASHSGLPQNIQWELKMTGLSTLGKRGRWMKSQQILISTLVRFVVKKGLAVRTHAGLAALKINRWAANLFPQDGLVFCVSST